MWWGENATSWELSDNGNMVCQGTLTARGNQAQEGRCSMMLESGSHELVVVLKNSDGETASAPKNITVKGGAGTTADNVSPSTKAPEKPVIAWMAPEVSEGNHTITWNMWWGENGSSWELYDNDEVVCDGDLTINGQQAQTSSCTIDLKEGSHRFQVALINEKGKTNSDTKTITVFNANPPGNQDSSITGVEGNTPSSEAQASVSTPDSSGSNEGVANNRVGSGDTPLYTDFNSSTLRRHKPYNNTSGKVVGTYFVEWGIYSRNYQPADLPAANLTHVLYGFLPICGPNDSLNQANPSGYRVLLSQCQGKPDFEVTIHDKYAALEKSYPGDAWDQDYKGTFNQFRRIKKAYPNLKILPSVGGWTLSDPFFQMDNNRNREVFVNSVVNFLKTYTFFDGVDIDWEFPGGGGANSSLGKASDSQTYVQLMSELRKALDNLGEETGKAYQLTSAIGASPEKIARVDFAAASRHMDYIFMMTYDYYGAWDGYLGHHAGLYVAQNSTRPTWNMDGAVKAMKQKGVSANKLIAGVAMYGRGWQGVHGVTNNNPLTGTGSAPLSLTKGNGHWENGVVDYFRIVEEMLGGDAQGAGTDGWVSGYDTTAEAAYVWNSQKGQFISYDNPRSTKAKAGYVRTQNLGGAFSWEIDADNGDILNAIHEGFNHPGLNH